MKEIRETGGEQVQKQLSPRRKMADAVITVEASFVMAVVLFVCGALISQGFYVHEYGNADSDGCAGAGPDRKREYRHSGDE